MDDGELDVEGRFQDLCADLNLDRNATVEAWNSYEKISENYTLEGDILHWLACALYVACRNSTVPTVGKPGTSVEGNCVSLTRLLRSCKLGLIQFFNKMKKWEDMANLPPDFRKKVDRLERNFAVSTVIFKKFKPIYLDLFKEPVDGGVPKHTKGRKPRRNQCTSSEVFGFCWTLFVKVKGNFPAISDDLVNSYHLLLSCMDLIFSNAVLADRKDLLNPDFSGLPENFKNRDYRPPLTPPCIIELLCKKHEGLVLEAKGIKEHWWKPHIRKLFDKKILKGKVDTLSGLLDLGNFDVNSKAISRAYEEYVLNVGDFDEQIFLGEDANKEIGTPAKVPMQGELAKKIKQHLEKTRSLAPSTPLTGRRYLVGKEAANITPVSTATQSVSKLQDLLAGRKTSPSDGLLEFFKDCTRNPMDSIVARVKEMGDNFCTCYAQPSEDDPGSHIEFAKRRLQLGECLYYKALEDILMMEKKRLSPNFDFSGLLERDVFHRILFACCIEIVIFSYNSQRTFPWIIEVFNLEPYDFYRVIELLIRAEDGLSRDVVKHLNLIEEQILECLAWKNESPLWDAIKVEAPIPSCEEVSLPSQMENMQMATIPPPQLLASPLPHPAVRRLAGLGPDRTGSRNMEQSPIAPSITDCFQSPTAGSPATTAKRRLFTGTVTGTTITVNPTVTVVTNGFATLSNHGKNAGDTGSILSPAKTVAMAMQTIQSENGIAYIPVNIHSASNNTTTTLTGTMLQVTTSGCLTTTTADSRQGSAVPTTNNKPKRTGSLCLFFRKFYHLASVRLRDLCDRLDVMEEDLRRKMWTCFEYSVIHHTDLMMDRHLDQLIMCAIYIMAKVTGKDQSFQDIMKQYRMQPQAASHVYRSVLLCTRMRRNSGSSNGSNTEASGSNSPVPMEREEDRRRDQLMIRSSSTLPVPHPSSQPPTPTRLAGTGSSFENEDRGDLIRFYNKVYVKKVQSFALKFSATKNKQVDSPPLSPLPRLKAPPMSPRRRVSNNHCIYISPLKANNIPSSPSRPMSYSFNRSPAKDLRAINTMLRIGERRVGKRLLQDDSEGESPSKRLCSDLTRKIQNVLTERQGAGSSTD